MPVLEEARQLGFLGPGPVQAHLDHAAGFAAAVATGCDGGAAAPPAQAVDLGSGGGLPGLPLALSVAACRWVLVESMARRAQFLRRAVEVLQLGHRVDVLEARAERVGHSPTARGAFDLVVARSFGSPGVVAECAGPLLRVGGRAVVSEPPGGAPARWPVDGLGILGMTAGPALVARGAAFQVLCQERPCPHRYPRRVGIPAKRPLF